MQCIFQAAGSTKKEVYGGDDGDVVINLPKAYLSIVDMRGSGAFIKGNGEAVKILCSPARRGGVFNIIVCRQIRQK